MEIVPDENLERCECSEYCDFRTSRPVETEGIYRVQSLFNSGTSRSVNFTKTFHDAIRRYCPLNIYESLLTIFNPLGGRWRHSTGKLVAPEAGNEGESEGNGEGARPGCCIIYHGRKREEGVSQLGLTGPEMEIAPAEFHSHRTYTVHFHARVETCVVVSRHARYSLRHAFYYAL